MFSRKVLFFGFLGGLTVVALAGVAGKTLVVNGVASANGVVTQGGKTYVSLDALKAAGAQVNVTPTKVEVGFVPLGGRNQVDAIEGDLGEWIQNDVWRLRVISGEETSNPYGRGPGYALRIELRNLSRRAVSPFATGMDKLQLIDSNGQLLSFNQLKFPDFLHDVAPGGGFTATVPFGDPTNKLESIGTPNKLLILFRNSGGKKAKDFRVFFPK